jgi:hypothetical protein
MSIREIASLSDREVYQQADAERQRAWKLAHEAYARGEAAAARVLVELISGVVPGVEKAEITSQPHEYATEVTLWPSQDELTEEDFDKAEAEGRVPKGTHDEYDAVCKFLFSTSLHSDWTLDFASGKLELTDWVGWWE